MPPRIPSTCPTGSKRYTVPLYPARVYTETVLINNSIPPRTFEYFPDMPINK